MNEKDILDEMSQLLSYLRLGKVTSEGEKARHYAITATEMEKVYAYFKTFIVDKLPKEAGETNG